MDSAATVVVSGAVVALTQLVKWAGLPDRWGPVAVMSLSIVGVTLWAYSKGPVYDAALLFDYFTGWIAVATGAAGFYGFTRAAASSVMRAMPPPNDGAGSSPTVKETGPKPLPPLFTPPSTRPPDEDYHGRR